MLGAVTLHETPFAIPPAPSSAAGRLGALLCAALPPQGAWSDEAYLWLTDHSRRLIEFTDGWLEELPMPTSSPLNADSCISRGHRPISHT